MQPLGTQHRHLAVPVAGSPRRQSLHCIHRLCYAVLYSIGSMVSDGVSLFFWAQPLLSKMGYQLRSTKDAGSQPETNVWLM